MAKSYTEAMLGKRQEYEVVRSQLMLDRSSFESHWKDLADYVKPRRLRQFVTDQNKGDRRNLKIIDSTASFALRTLQSGMHAGLTSPARPWFKLSTPDPDLAEFAPVKTWLHDVTQRMLSVFVKSNLYTALPTVYGDEGLFATAAMGVLDDNRDVFRCYPYPIGTYCIGVSSRGTVDTFIREFQMTVRQIVRDFAWDPETNEIDWTNVSVAVKGLWDRAAYEQQVEVCWIVTPNKDANPDRLGSKYLPWASCWFEKGDSKDDRFLRESGFNEFPVMVGRWDVVAEDAYGTDCPGMTALGDIRQLQTMVKRKAQAVEKFVNPPLQAPTSLQNKVVSSLPGGVNHVDVNQANQGIKSLYDMAANIEHLRADIEDIRFMIRRSFYEDLFLMLAQTDRPEMTAREIAERHEEKLLALGPVIERNNDELHEPLIDRIYPMMERAELIPPPPPDLEGVELKVEYLSIMSQAQKMVGMSGMDRFVASTVPMIQAFPELRHKFAPYKIVDEYADSLGVHPDSVVPTEQALQALQAERKAQAAMAQAEAAATMAKGARDLGATDLEKDTPLKRMMEGAAV